MKTPVRLGLEIAVSAGLTAAGYIYFVGYRSDYLGHYLAGFGGTLLILSCFLFVARGRLRWELPAGVLIAIGVGAGLETTIFRLAIFDSVDFFNQSLGAAVAGICVFGHDGGAAQGGTALVLGAVLVLLGFRYAFA